MTTEPLHVAIVNGKLRFFRSPYNDGRPDFPWQSTDDLQSVFGLNPAGFFFLLRSIGPRAPGDKH